MIRGHKDEERWRLPGSGTSRSKRPAIRSREKRGRGEGRRTKALHRTRASLASSTTPQRTLLPGPSKAAGEAPVTAMPFCGRGIPLLPPCSLVGRASLRAGIHPQTPKGFHKMRAPTVTAMHGIEMIPDVVFVEPFQGSRSMWAPTQGCASLTLGCWMNPLRGKDRRSPETRRRAAGPGGCTRTRARSESSVMAPWPLLTSTARAAGMAPVSHRPFCGLKTSHGLLVQGVCE